MKKLTDNTPVNGEKLKDFPLPKIRNNSQMSTLITLFHIVLEVLAKTIRQVKEIKYIQIGKEELKLYICR